MTRKEGNQKKALLIMDMQNAVLSRIQNAEKLIQHVNAAIEGAQAAGVKVLYVKLGFKEGYPEIDDDHLLFGGLKHSGGIFMESHESGAFVSGLKIKDTDTVIVKKRVSAFTGSDLDIILRANQIGSLILTGVSTTGVVLSTLREACDKDYQVSVLTNACADPDPEVHEFLINKVFPFSGRTLSTEGWLREL